MLIEDIGQRLSHKPFEWKSWWWGIKWESFIDISPQLTIDHPLWQREASHLETIRLCGLPPNALQAEIAAYWEKPFWRRWFLSFFTDIDNKIVIWSYYKRCLSFRIIHKENPALEQRLRVYDPEQRFVNLLLDKLKQDIGVLENRLERYCGNAKWVEKNLSWLLVKNEIKRHRFFLKVLNKHLNVLPEGCDRASVREKLEDEYQVIERILRQYVQNACQASISPQLLIPSSSEENHNRDLVYVGPAVVSERKLSPYVSNGCSIESINDWLALKRETIKDLLKETPSSYESIRCVLASSLNDLQSRIESQLADYENVITEVTYRRVNYKTALNESECLQRQLSYFFRQSGLLFHPDKSDGDETLRRIKTELFKEFQQFAEHSLERLSQGLRLLKRCIPKWKVDFDKTVEEMRRDQREFSERMSAQQTRIRAQQARISAQQAEIRAQQAEMRAKIDEISAGYKQMGDQLKTLMKQQTTPPYPEEVNDSACATQVFCGP